jgi:hypothetical protein
MARPGIEPGTPRFSGMPAIAGKDRKSPASRDTTDRVRSAAIPVDNRSCPRVKDVADPPRPFQILACATSRDRQSERPRRRVASSTAQRPPSASATRGRAQPGAGALNVLRGADNSLGAQAGAPLDGRLLLQRGPPRRPRHDPPRHLKKWRDPESNRTSPSSSSATRVVSRPSMAAQAGHFPSPIPRKEIADRPTRVGRSAGSPGACS